MRHPQGKRRRISGGAGRARRTMKIGLSKKGPPDREKRILGMSNSAMRPRTFDPVGGRGVSRLLALTRQQQSVHCWSYDENNNCTIFLYFCVFFFSFIKHHRLLPTKSSAHRRQTRDTHTRTQIHIYQEVSVVLRRPGYTDCCKDPANFIVWPFYLPYDQAHGTTCHHPTHTKALQPPRSLK